EGIALSSCVLAWDIDQWPGPMQEYSGHHTGWHDVRLVPDLATLRPAAWLERTAIVIADFAELESDDRVPVAPRTILHRQVGNLTQTGLTPQVASELEFSLYRGTYDEGRSNGYETLRPTTLARADYTVQAGDQHEGFFARAREALSDSDLGPWTSQVEWGLGQWEINLEHRDALEMADRHILFKLAMRDLAAAEGMSLTFMARPFADTTGSSCHLHLSLVHAAGTNVFHDPEAEHGVSATLRHAVGGVLAHAPELMLLYAPTVNSYRRTGSGEFSGNGLSWGYDSRMVSCRVLPEGTATRLEWRVPGADVNPYLAIAGLLASVGDGIANATDPGEPLMGWDFDKEVPPLPGTLGEAVAAFRDGAFAAEALGKEVVAHYAEAGRWEWERFLAPEAVSEWERRRYFEVI
ncbi:MAG TPA: glutamine synthetase family protein, partial [Actinomycetota bacterium]|nr:glutamine synthetase family protein [Actinomycetota bacterium]